VRPALILSVTLLVAACGPSLAPAAGVSPATTPRSVASAPQIAPPPVTPPTPPGNNLPAFACANTGGGKTAVAHTVTARVAANSGYDRFVLQFDSAVPTYTVKRQAKPVFPAGPSGQTITVSGTVGVLVQVHSATGATTFTGPTDFQHPEYQILKEARQTEDFEGYVSWGLGLSQADCMRTFTLADPPRLVVDFVTTG
jgi:hypothetical protein